MEAIRYIVIVVKIQLMNSYLVTFPSLVPISCLSEMPQARYAFLGGGGFVLVQNFMGM